MNQHPYDLIPELAGVATYSEAARIGHSVDENVRRLLRYHWVERSLMSTLIARLTAEPVWELKCAFALHQWLHADHVDALRARIGEMRSPVPPLGSAPDSAIETFLTLVRSAETSAELLTAVYQVAYPALADAYLEHLATTNALVDQPTGRILRNVLTDLEDAIDWGNRALDALIAAQTPDSRVASDFVDRLRTALDAAGGIAGPASPTAPPSAPPLTPNAPSFHPRRDERFHGQYNFNFPPHIVYNAPGVPSDERNLALLCKRTLEMDVPEMMASFITERADQPWEFYRDYSRQLWDEARHAMMGSVALEARGIDWKGEIPLNVSFALRLNLHAEPLERQMMLFAIEQSLMPADTGKRFEYETARAAGDELSAHFHDYDWADEVLHSRIGRRALKRDGVTGEQARERAVAVHEKTWAALDGYRDRDPQRPWWGDFVRRALGHPSAVDDETQLGRINIFAE